MAELFPEEFEDEEELIEEDLEEEVTGYHPGYYFDFETGDYKQNGTYGIVDATGVEAWKQWCIKCLNTQKGSCDAYIDFGVDYDSAFRAEERDKTESDLTSSITEALMADPYQRTQEIESIEYEWESDEVTVYVTVIGIENVTIDISARVGGV